MKAATDSCPPETVKEMVAVAVPEVNAVYPGGAQQMIKYIRDHVVNKISLSQDEAITFRRPVVQWVVDESGQVTEVGMLKSSGITRIDTLLVYAVKRMPQWTPAESAGKKVRQQFRIPLQICFR